MANFRSLKTWGPKEFLEWAESNYPANRIVEMLYLDRSGMTVLPTQIDRLVNLTNIDLSHNRLSRLPNTITNLSKLRQLDVSSNRLTQLPAGIWDSGITTINLSDNMLVDLPSPSGPRGQHGPRWRPSNINILLLSHNRLTALPEWFVFPNASYIDLSYNQLSEIVLFHFPGFLDLSYNRLTDLYIHDDVDADRLDSLILSHNLFSTIPFTIRRAAYNIRTLDMSYNLLETLDPEEIPRSLEFLYIQGNQLADIPFQDLNDNNNGLLIHVDRYFRDRFDIDANPFPNLTIIFDEDNEEVDTKPAREMPLGSLSFGFHGRRHPSMTRRRFY